MVKTQAEAPSSAHVSAFAARKASQTPLADVKSGNASRDTQSSVVLTKTYENSPPPLKRQRVDPLVRTLSIPLLSRSGELKELGEDANPPSENEAPDHGSQSLRFDENSKEDEVSGYNSEDNGDSDSGSEIILRPGLPPTQQLSSFIPTTTNVVGETDSEWTINLDEKDSLAMVGQYDIWVRKGAVSIAGAVLRPSSALYRVYAPSTHSIPAIRSIRDPYGPEHQLTQITILSCNSRLRLLKQLSPRFGRIWNHKQITAPGSIQKVNMTQRSFVHLNSSIEDPYNRPLHLLEPPISWLATIDQILSNDLKRPAAIMVCGPKSSGKSTFCRILANAMFTRLPGDCVALLDLDPGQPEFSPPGEVSLIKLQSCNFGVPFTHPTAPFTKGIRLIRSHHIGALSPKDDPEHYLKCVMDLLGHYWRILELSPSCPLILNCSGWVQGSGLELLVEFIHRMSVTHILYTSILGPKEVVDTLIEAANKAKRSFRTMISQPTEFTTRTAADLRMMQSLSYFHLDLPEGDNLRWNASPINELAPLTVHYAGPAQAIFGIMVLDEEQDPEFFVSLLDGCIVGLVAIEDDSAIPLERGNINSVDVESLEGALDESPLHAEHTCQTVDTTISRPGSLYDLRQTSISDSDSDSEIVDRSRAPFQNHTKDSPETAKLANGVSFSIEHLHHPAIARNSDDLPYLSASTGITIPLDPRKSRSLGQALIRSINTYSKTLHLTTPIPQSTLQSLHQKRTKIVLVRGKLDTPTWAYKEELVLAAAKKRKRKTEDGKPQRFTTDDVREWAKGVPWAKVVDGSEVKSQGAKVWKVQRHLRPRASGAEESD